MSRLLTITPPNNNTMPASYYSILDPQYSPLPLKQNFSIIKKFGFTNPNYYYGHQLYNESAHKKNPNLGMQAYNTRSKLIQSKILKKKYDILTHTINMLNKQIQKTLLNGKNVSEKLQRNYNSAWSERAIVNAWSEQAIVNAMKGNNGSTRITTQKKRKSSNRN